MAGKLAYEKVYDEMKRRIASGEWEPGSRLPTIEQLSALFGVGVSTVREAVRILGKQKIVRIEQGRGTFVSSELSASPPQLVDVLERASIRQLTDARLIVEPELAALAARHATAEAREAIVRDAEAMRRKAAAGRDFLAEDIRFHERIAAAAANEVLAGMMAHVNDLLLDSRRTTMKWPGMNEKASSYHMLIAQAIAGRDEERARTLMRLHLEDMRNELDNDETKERP
ncbi:MAG: FadR family transcriptional regulator [Paenibacillaceae bacterium]|uniref:FadR/GntR family transcriptional regulator n=1 Tax=Paenibacillus cymbidii TaxID=1639034 RepID=UPI001080E018|nr:FCD domain-containing protein [Paenibacillus cymbidii]MBO9607427.1 FadR family transcriptional regulator [Paenibacillaceae bacterium]